MWESDLQSGMRREGQNYFRAENRSTQLWDASFCVDKRIDHLEGNAVQFPNCIAEWMLLATEYGHSQLNVSF